jgi:hypothetical protein
MPRGATWCNLVTKQNGTGRIGFPPLLPSALSDRRWPAAAHQMQDQGDEEQSDEDVEQELSEPAEDRGDAAESEQGRDQRNQKENQGPIQHDGVPFLHVLNAENDLENAVTWTKVPPSPAGRGWERSVSYTLPPHRTARRNSCAALCVLSPLSVGRSAEFHAGRKPAATTSFERRNGREISSVVDLGHSDSGLGPDLAPVRTLTGADA